MILVFKGRWFCLSGHSKNTIQFGEDVPNRILYPVHHRQFVFIIPIMLRIYFTYDRKLLTKLFHCANEGLQMFFSMTWDGYTKPICPKKDVVEVARSSMRVNLRIIPTTTVSHRGGLSLLTLKSAQKWL